MIFEITGNLYRAKHAISTRNLHAKNVMRTNQKKSSNDDHFTAAPGKNANKGRPSYLEALGNGRRHFHSRCQEEAQERDVANDGRPSTERHEVVPAQQKPIGVTFTKKQPHLFNHAKSPSPR
jgi:hypothetical protein